MSMTSILRLTLAGASSLVGVSISIQAQQTAAPPGGQGAGRAAVRRSRPTASEGVRRGAACHQLNMHGQRRSSRQGWRDLIRTMVWLPTSSFRYRG
jgi:hypothetical protein